MSFFKPNAFKAALLSSLLISGALLSGCANTVVTQKKTYFTVESLYTEAANISVQYIAGNFGTPDPAVVKQIKFFNDQAHNALLAVRTKVESGATISDTSLALASTTIDSFVAYLAAHNLKVTSTDSNVTAAVSTNTAAISTNTTAAVASDTSN